MMWQINACVLLLLLSGSALGANIRNPSSLEKTDPNLPVDDEILKVKDIQGDDVTQEIEDIQGNDMAQEIDDLEADDMAGDLKDIQTDATGHEDNDLGVYGITEEVEDIRSDGTAQDANDLETDGEAEDANDLETDGGAQEDKEPKLLDRQRRQSGSHTWNHRDGSSSTLGLRGSSGQGHFGVSGSHTTRRGTMLGADFDNYRGAGTYSQIRASQTFPVNRGSFTVGGRTSFNPRGQRTSSGLSLSRTWNHRNGRQTTLGGYMDRNRFTGRRSGGIRLSHRFRRSAPGQRETRVGSHTWEHDDGSSSSLELRENNPQGYVGGSASHTTRHGTSVGLDLDRHSGVGTFGSASVGQTVSHHGGETSVGANVQWNPRREMTSRTFSGSRSWDTGNGQATIGGSVTNDRWGHASRDLSASRTWNHDAGGSTTLGGHVSNDRFGQVSRGLSLSRTWNHRGGRQTTFGAHVNRHRFGGTSGGFRLTHRFRRSLSRPRRQSQSASRTWNHSDGSSSTLGIRGNSDLSHLGVSGSHTTRHGTMVGADFDRYRGVGTYSQFRGGQTFPVNRGSFTLGGRAGFDPQGRHISSGLSASRTWNHGGGRQTTFGGYVDRDRYSGTSGGLRLTHRF